MTKDYYKRQAAANIFNQQNAIGSVGADSETSPYTDELRAAFPAAAPSVSRTRVAESAKKAVAPGADLVSSEELQLAKEPIQVREVGFWPFRHVIVPPNVHVVQTRLGRREPVTIGMGLSFPFNSWTDAYLVVPAAMQTIGIVANSISREKQGINVLAYVQWQIQDFSVAYRKLDFSDLRDPLGIVNAQLREQAEAAIKDKIATMSVDEVLTDKQPIIEELTARLKAVAEGRGDGVSSEGLGIKIVTVQIKEAYVSSLKLWEHLQAPFRHEQEKIARIALLTAQEEVREKEMENRKLAETSEAETMVQIESIKQNTQTEAQQTRLTQELSRLSNEQESDRKRVQLGEETVLFKQESQRRLQMEAAKLDQERKILLLRQSQEETVEKARLDTEAGARLKTLQIEQALKELAEQARLAEQKLVSDKQQVVREMQLKNQEAELDLAMHKLEANLQRLQQEATLARARTEQTTRLELEEAAERLRLTVSQKEIELARLRQDVENLVNQAGLATRVIEKLPQLAEHMPEVHELKVLQMGDREGYDSLAAFLARVMAMAETLGIQMGKKEDS